MVRMPWAPTRSSPVRERAPTQTMGETSTPARGGITLRVARSRGSVGTYASAQGSLRPSISGYHVMGIRMTKSAVLRFNVGPSTLSTSAACSCGVNLALARPSRNAPARPHRRLPTLPLRHTALLAMAPSTTPSALNALSGCTHSSLQMEMFRAALRDSRQPCERTYHSLRRLHHIMKITKGDASDEGRQPGSTIAQGAAYGDERLFLCWSLNIPDHIAWYCALQGS